MTNVYSVAERNEILQGVIDRMLYLKQAEREEFLNYIDILFEKYSIEVSIVQGTRIYKKQTTNQ
jgi:hypothetical protein